MKKLSARQLVGIAILFAVLAYIVWNKGSDPIPEGFYTGNGRIEATEIDIATKLAGRIEKILVDEGDFVTKGQSLAIMQTDVLTAQLYEAEAQKHAAIASVARAKANIVLRESDRDAAKAVVAQRESELDAGQRRLNRSAKLSKTGAVAIQQFDDDETFVAGAKAAVDTSKAQVIVAEAALEAAKAEAAGAEANVKAAEATVGRIQADITDSTLLAPCDGRIQYRVSQPGEVLPAGGKVLNLVDLSDVYMTFFLPSAEAGRLSIGNEARIVLDAAPEYPIPAQITFVSSVAQFTPKTVETHSEREKLMFRIKAQINRDLLRHYIQYVKTGLPGVAWVKASSTREWPAKLVLHQATTIPPVPSPVTDASAASAPIANSAPKQTAQTANQGPNKSGEPNESGESGELSGPGELGELGELGESGELRAPQETPTNTEESPTPAEALPEGNGHQSPANSVSPANTISPESEGQHDEP